MPFTFRKAQPSEGPAIWEILKSAIAQRKAEGSNQWQDGYPNLEVVQDDLRKGVAFVLTDGNNIVGYCAVLINDEPEYNHIVGEWLTQKDFVVFHRVAIAKNYLGQGLAKKMLQYIEDFALSKNIYSVKADTNFDNLAMLKTFEKSGYVFCGEVYFRGSPRKAYEKVLGKLLN